MMNTTGISKNWGALAAAALILGMSAAAQGETLEEITVHGTSAAARAQQENFEAEMAAYVRSVEAAIEDARRLRLQMAPLPQIRLALAAGSHRG
jgi:hypothetical protein